MTARRHWLRRMIRDRQGVAAVEFAFTAPIFLLILLAIFDFGWQMYAKQILQGAVSHSARAATLEGYANNQAELDALVAARVGDVLSEGEIFFSRKAYESYDDIGDPEPYTDRNRNNRYDSGECFEDLNGSGGWDSDRGKTGNGGAEDVVLYTVTVTFDRLFPAWVMLGQPRSSTISATTVLRNQPYNTATRTTQVICT